MRVTLKSIHMGQERSVEIRIWIEQKGAQYQDTFGRGCAWYARVGALITKGTQADCMQACELIAGMEANYLLADRGYDSNNIIEQAQQQKITAVIPPKKNRLQQREYDRNLYKLRHLVENAFLHLKRWRGIATRYAKNAASFLAAVQIRCIALWVNIL